MAVNTTVVELPLTPPMAELLRSRLAAAVRRGCGHIEIKVNPKGVIILSHEESRLDWEK